MAVVWCYVHAHSFSVPHEFPWIFKCNDRWRSFWLMPEVRPGQWLWDVIAICMAAVGMSEAIPLLLPYTFMAWKGTTLPSTLTKVCLFCTAVRGSMFYPILSVWTVEPLLSLKIYICNKWALDSGVYSVLQNTFLKYVFAATGYAFLYACLLCQKVLYDFRNIVTEYHQLNCCKQYAFISA